MGKLWKRHGKAMGEKKHDKRNHHKNTMKATIGDYIYAGVSIHQLIIYTKALHGMPRQIRIYYVL